MPKPDCARHTNDGCALAAIVMLVATVSFAQQPIAGSISGVLKADSKKSKEKSFQYDENN